MAVATVPKEITWSPSRLNLWEQCPQRWFHKYVLEEPDPASQPAAFGLAVHEALERIIPVVGTLQFGPVKGLTADRWPPALLGLINRILSDQLTAHAPLTDPIKDMQDATRAVEQALKAISFAPKVTVERVLVGRLSELDRVQGRLDLTMFYPDRVVIRDFKTGRVPYPVASAAQLPIYGLLAHRKWQLPVTIELHWLRHQDSIESLEATDDVLDGARQWLVDRIATVRASLDAYHGSNGEDTSVFRARPGSHCAHCPVAARCSVADQDALMASVTEADASSSDSVMSVPSAFAVPDEIQEKAKKILVLERQLDELRGEVKDWYKEHKTPIIVGDGAFMEVSSKKLEITDQQALITAITNAGYSPADFMTLNKSSYESWTKKATKDGHAALVESLSPLVQFVDGSKTFKFQKGGEDHA